MQAPGFAFFCFYEIKNTGIPVLRFNKELIIFAFINNFYKMQSNNLLYIIDSPIHLKQPLQKNYLDFKAVNIKPAEIKTMRAFRENLREQMTSSEAFDHYIIGYQIPQIGKEFDLLRFGRNSIINIELKSSSTLEKIKKQLLENRYYLGFLDKEIFSYTFVEDSNKLYSLDSSNNLVESDFKHLSDIITNQVPEQFINIDLYFKPSNYLVSPFNSTDAFIKAKYFLTNHQTDIKNQVLNFLNDDITDYISIKGKAGTGKTLLVYDIANSISNDNKQVLIIHCGQLNNGQRKLIIEHNWNIIPIKDCKTINYHQYQIIIIDEVQRIYPEQLDYIINSGKENGMKYIFSYDGQQCLQKREIQNNIEEKIANFKYLKSFTLTEKIRTNKEIANFIYGLFDKKFPTIKTNYSNIQIQYCLTSNEANSYISYLMKREWIMIKYTPTSYKTYPYDVYGRMSLDSAHQVIGQEYEKVIAVIDEHFYYNESKLSTHGYKKQPYYHPTKMLFQIMSRTRSQLCLIIVKNPEILERCLEILDPNRNNQN